MATVKDKNLNVLENELKFIGRHINNMQTADFDTVDEINMAIDSTLRALHEHKLDLQPAREDIIPAGVPLAA